MTVDLDRPSPPGPGSKVSAQRATVPVITKVDALSPYVGICNFDVAEACLRAVAY